MNISWSIVSNKHTNESKAKIDFPEGDTLEVKSSHTHYKEIISELVSINSNTDLSSKKTQILSLFHKASLESERLTKLSERIACDGSNIYFDGDIIESTVTKDLIQALRRSGIIGGIENKDNRNFDETDKTSWLAIVSFLEKLYQNPSKESIENLYSFISQHGLTILENGDFIAFKGLLSDYRSVHSGPGIVNGRRMINAHLDNSPGNIVEIARSYVDTDTSNECSKGLHVGSSKFARTFASKHNSKVMVAVSVNPRDVVATGDGLMSNKMRVVRYRVLHTVIDSVNANNNDFLYDENEAENIVETFFRVFDDNKTVGKDDLISVSEELDGTSFTDTAGFFDCENCLDFGCADCSDDEDEEYEDVDFCKDDDITFVPTVENVINGQFGDKEHVILSELSAAVASFVEEIRESQGNSNVVGSDSDLVEDFTKCNCADLDDGMVCNSCRLSIIMRNTVDSENNGGVVRSGDKPSFVIDLDGHVENFLDDDFMDNPF